MDPGLWTGAVAGPRPPRVGYRPAPRGRRYALRWRGGHGRRPMWPRRRLDAVRRPDSVRPSCSIPRVSPFRAGPGAGPRDPAPHLVFLCPRYEGVDERNCPLCGRPGAVDRGMLWTALTLRHRSAIGWLREATLRGAVRSINSGQHAPKRVRCRRQPIVLRRRCSK